MNSYGPDNTPLRRFNVKHLKSEVLKALNLEKGLLHTVINLTIRPGIAINTYLFEDRTKLTKPLPFLLLTVAIATFLTLNFIDMGDAFMAGGEINTESNDPKTAEFMESLNEVLSQSFNIIQLFSVPFMAIAAYLVFNDKRYNYAEHLVFGAYLTGMLNTFYILTFPIAMMDYRTYSIWSVLLFLVYASFAYSRVFGLTFWEGTIKGLATQLLYYIAYFLVMFIFGIGLAAFFIFKQKG